MPSQEDFNLSSLTHEPNVKGGQFVKNSKPTTGANTAFNKTLSDFRIIGSPLEPVVIRTIEQCDKTRSAMKINRPLSDAVPERGSQSTPSYKRSHVRVLDFKTPNKSPGLQNSRRKGRMQRTLFNSPSPERSSKISRKQGNEPILKQCPSKRKLDIILEESLNLSNQNSVSDDTLPPARKKSRVDNSVNNITEASSSTVSKETLSNLSESLDNKTDHERSCVLIPAPVARMKESSSSNTAGAQCSSSTVTQPIFTIPTFQSEYYTTPLKILSLEPPTPIDQHIASNRKDPSTNNKNELNTPMTIMFPPASPCPKTPFSKTVDAKITSPYQYSNRGINSALASVIANNAGINLMEDETLDVVGENENTLQTASSSHCKEAQNTCDTSHSEQIHSPQSRMSLSPTSMGLAIERDLQMTLEKRDSMMETEDCIVQEVSTNVAVVHDGLECPVKMIKFATGNTCHSSLSTTNNESLASDSAVDSSAGVHSLEGPSLGGVVTIVETNEPVLGADGVIARNIDDLVGQLEAGTINLDLPSSIDITTLHPTKRRKKSKKSKKSSKRNYDKNPKKSKKSKCRELSPSKRDFEHITEGILPKESRISGGQEVNECNNSSSAGASKPRAEHSDTLQSAGSLMISTNDTANDSVLATTPTRADTQGSLATSSPCITGKRTSPFNFKIKMRSSPAKRRNKLSVTRNKKSSKVERNETRPVNVVDLFGPTSEDDWDEDTLPDLSTPLPTTTPVEEDAIVSSREQTLKRSVISSTSTCIPLTEQSSSQINNSSNGKAVSTVHPSSSLEAEEEPTHLLNSPTESELKSNELVDVTSVPEIAADQQKQEKENPNIKSKSIKCKRKKKPPVTHTLRRSQRKIQNSVYSSANSSEATVTSSNRKTGVSEVEINLKLAKKKSDSYKKILKERENFSAMVSTIDQMSKKAEVDNVAASTVDDGESASNLLNTKNTLIADEDRNEAKKIIVSRRRSKSISINSPKESLKTRGSENIVPAEDTVAGGSQTEGCNTVFSNWGGTDDRRPLMSPKVASITTSQSPSKIWNKWASSLSNNSDDANIVINLPTKLKSNLLTKPFLNNHHQRRAGYCSERLANNFKSPRSCESLVEGRAKCHSERKSQTKSPRSRQELFPSPGAVQTISGFLQRSPASSVSGEGRPQL